MIEQNLTPEQKKALHRSEGTEGDFIPSETGPVIGKKPVPDEGGSLSKFPKPTREQMLQATQNQPVPREMPENLNLNPDLHKQFLTELINEGKVTGKESEVVDRVLGMDSPKN